MSGSAVAAVGSELWRRSKSVLRHLSVAAGTGEDQLARAGEGLECAVDGVFSEVGGDRVCAERPTDRLAPYPARVRRKTQQKGSRAL